MIELFAKPLAELALEDVRAFLAGVDDEEGVTWEAKADEDKRRGKVKGDEAGELYPTTIHKAVSAFANQVGGYLIIGARWDKDARKWRLPGVKVREHEAASWLSKVIGGMQPVPRFSPPRRRGGSMTTAWRTRRASASCGRVGRSGGRSAVHDAAGAHL